MIINCSRCGAGLTESWWSRSSSFSFNSSSYSKISMDSLEMSMMSLVVCSISLADGSIINSIWLGSSYLMLSWCLISSLDSSLMKYLISAFFSATAFFFFLILSNMLCFFCFSAIFLRENLSFSLIYELGRRCERLKNSGSASHRPRLRSCYRLLAALVSAEISRYSLGWSQW